MFRSVICLMKEVLPTPVIPITPIKISFFSSNGGASPVLAFQRLLSVRGMLLDACCCLSLLATPLIRQYDDLTFSLRLLWLILAGPVHCDLGYQYRLEVFCPVVAKRYLESSNPLITSINR